MRKMRKVSGPERKINLNKKENNSGNAQLTVKTGLAGAAAACICGDAADSCGLPDGGRALILSDGMGKGIKAAAESRMVVSRLRRNLNRGMTVAHAIKEVNRHMIEKSGQTCGSRESFATADLVVVDCSRRRARFYKMGAAPSFLVRDGRVRRIERGALPVGIIPKLKLSGISRNLRDCDMIIMVSDGITDSDRGDLSAGWLEELLSKADPSDPPRRTARAILKRAEENYGDREKDDMTVIAAVISDN